MQATEACCRAPSLPPTNPPTCRRYLHVHCCTSFARSLARSLMHLRKLYRLFVLFNFLFLRKETHTRAYANEHIVQQRVMQNERERTRVRVSKDYEGQKCGGEHVNTST